MSNEVNNVGIPIGCKVEITNEPLLVQKIMLFLANEHNQELKNLPKLQS